MKKLPLTVCCSCYLGCLVWLSAPSVALAQQSDSRYMDYTTALSQMTSQNTAKKNAVRERFPFNTTLFESNKVQTLPRRNFNPPVYNSGVKAAFPNSFTPPTSTSPGSTLTRPTDSGEGGTDSSGDFGRY